VFRIARNIAADWDFRDKSRAAAEQARVAIATRIAPHPTAPPSSINFQGLQSRLVIHLRQRVRSGEISERSLARVTGLSQPHLHNVLKGKRFLSFEKIDQILHQLHLDLLDFIK
jgi:hypothetical protein